MKRDDLGDPIGFRTVAEERHFTRGGLDDLLAERSDAGVRLGERVEKDRRRAGFTRGSSNKTAAR